MTSPLDNNRLVGSFLLPVANLTLKICLLCTKFGTAVQEFLGAGERFDCLDLRGVFGAAGGSYSVDTILGIFGNEVTPFRIHCFQLHFDSTKEFSIGSKFDAVGGETFRNQSEAGEAVDALGVEGDTFLELWTHGQEPVLVGTCVCTKQS